MPERSGLPSAVFGAGADRFGRPFGSRGISGVLNPIHCAAADADFRECSLEVVLHGERRDGERRRDLLGASSLGGETGDLAFTRREAVRAGDHLAEGDGPGAFDDDPDLGVTDEGRCVKHHPVAVRGGERGVGEAVTGRGGGGNGPHDTGDPIPVIDRIEPALGVVADRRDST